MHKSAFGVDHGVEISKWTEITDRKTGQLKAFGGYYGDYTVPKGTTHTYQQPRKKALGIIPRKPKTVNRTFDKDTTMPIMRYINTSDGRSKYVLPSDMPRQGFDPKKINTQNTRNDPGWKMVAQKEQNYRNAIKSGKIKPGDPGGYAANK